VFVLCSLWDGCHSIAVRRLLKNSSELQLQHPSGLLPELPHEVLQELPVLQSVANGQTRLSPDELARAMDTLNRLLTHQQTDMDRKVFMCREATVKAKADVTQTAKQLRALGGRISFSDAAIAESVPALPQLEEAYDELKEDVMSGRRDCLHLQQEEAAGELQLAADAKSVHAIYDLVNGHCQQLALLHSLPSATGPCALALNSAEATQVKQQLNQTSPSLRQQLIALLETQELQHCGHSKDDCLQVAESLDEVLGSFQDRLVEQRRDMSETQKMCQGDRVYEEEALAGISNKRDHLSTQLSEAAAQVSELAEQQRQKKSLLANQHETLQSLEDSCAEEAKSLKRSIFCSIRSVRDSLALLHNSALPEDCEVSDWHAGVCNATCGGGEQVWSREVVLPRNGGVECPALSMTAACAETACPVHCEVAEWSPWSACTVDCGGGVQQRTRAVSTAAQHGGDACPPTVDMRLCHLEACDRDCILASWSDWGACDTSTGTESRLRSVEADARGSGACPSEDDTERAESRFCQVPGNMTASGHRGPTKALGYCDAPLDLVLLLDSSSSLDAQTFESLRALSTQLVEQLLAKHAAGLRVALLAFNDAAHVSFSLTSDKAAAVAASEQVAWLRGTTRLGVALLAAQDMFVRYGRSRGHQAILILTDGRISDPVPASTAAKRLLQESIHIHLAAVGAFRKATWPAVFGAQDSAVTHFNNVTFVMDEAAEAAEDLIADFCKVGAA